MYLPSSSAAPGTSSLRGWNEPTPPAITTAPASNTVPAPGHDAEAAVLLPRDFGHFLAEMQARAERPDLLEQPIGQLLPRAHRHGRNVVDRLVGIQLDALAAGRLQRIDDLRLQAEQAQLEHLEQPARPGADDDDVRVDRVTLELKRGVGVRRHEQSPGQESP